MKEFSALPPFILIALSILGFILAVLTILMPYYVYRINRNMKKSVSILLEQKEILRKMLVKIPAEKHVVPNT